MINYTGLNDEEISKLRRKYGYNELIKTTKINPFKKFLSVFKEPMFLLLVFTSLIYLILGEPREALIMFIFISFIATITFVQEWKTEKTMEALKDLTSPKVTVIRNSKKFKINSTELLPGDIIYLTEGDRIPADCSVLEASNFSVDESSLTGESVPVFKTPKSKSIKDNNHFKKYLLYAGTLATFGSSIAKVEKIGQDTEYGKIGLAISMTKESKTPLQNKVSKLVKNLAILGLILCISVIIFSFLYTNNIIKSILSGITLAMAIIPEEFPVVLTVFLSLGAFRLAKKNTLIRKIPAVETLGSTTVLCVDKTGTITQNKMSVTSVYQNFNNIPLNNVNDLDFIKLLVLSSERNPYDPMEKAIINFSKEITDLNDFYSLKLAKSYPFDSKTKKMANAYIVDGGYYIASKGSPEKMLDISNLDQKEKLKILEDVDSMAKKGLRVLAFCDGYSKKVNEDISEYNLEFKGLIGLQDPPKPFVSDAIKICKKASVRVIMITGDYSKTAISIGTQIGLSSNSKTLNGDIIDKMSDSELEEAVKNYNIFSRVIPSHKMRIVNALKKNGEVVAMTGDGINDAPALKNADIGISMGKRGTEAAKEASHMILMDDNFTTIVNSIEDGRRVYDNIRKAMVYIMVIHIPIMALALFAPIFNIPQILLPAHIVILELILDPTCSIVFEGEPKEEYIMEKPPRPKDEPLLTKPLAIKVIIQGTVMFLASFLPFYYLINSGASEDYSRTFSLVVLIIANIFLVLVNRSNTKYIFSIFKEKQNKARFYINSIALLILLSIIYIPYFHQIFKTTYLSLNSFLIAALIGFISTSWFEIVKLYNNNKRK